MHVLIDYDNVERVDRRTLVGLSEAVVNSIGIQRLPAGEVQIKLYGGWYEGQRLTKMAQSLAIEVQRDFRRTINIGDAAGAVFPIKVGLEMGFAMEIDKRTPIYHTYRAGGPTRKVDCLDPYSTGCVEPQCPLVSVQRYVQSRKCPLASCALPATSQDMLVRSEQKLVDTMLTADLIYLAQTAPVVGIVTSDDDLWPAIKTVVLMGKTVVHIHTNKFGRRTPAFYNRGFGIQYIELDL